MRGARGFIYGLFRLWAIPVCSVLGLPEGNIVHPKEAIKTYRSIVVKSGASKVQHAPQNTTSSSHNCSIFRYIDL